MREQADTSMTIRLSPSASFDYAIDVDTGLAVARMAGTLTGPDMQRIVETVHKDPAWETSFDAIWDCSTVRAHVVEPDEVAPIIDDMVDGKVSEADIGRDVLIENAYLAESMFSQMLVLRLRRKGEDAYVAKSMDQALSLLDVDSLPVALALEDGSASVE